MKSMNFNVLRTFKKQRKPFKMKFAIKLGRKTIIVGLRMHTLFI